MAEVNSKGDDHDVDECHVVVERRQEGGYVRISPGL